MASSGKPAPKNRRFDQSLRHAWRGMIAAVRTERNVRIDLGGCVVVALLGVLLHVARRDWLWLIVACGSVLALELLNSSLEALVRLQVGPNFDPDPLVSRVLDIAAGAVLVAAVMAVLIGVIVFWPYLQEVL